MVLSRREFVEYQLQENGICVEDQESGGIKFNTCLLAEDIFLQNANWLLYINHVAQDNNMAIAEEDLADYSVVLAWFHNHNINIESVAESYNKTVKGYLEKLRQVEKDKYKTAYNKSMQKLSELGRALYTELDALFEIIDPVWRDTLMRRMSVEDIYEALEENYHLLSRLREEEARERIDRESERTPIVEVLGGYCCVQNGTRGLRDVCLPQDSPLAQKLEEWLDYLMNDNGAQEWEEESDAGFFEGAILYGNEGVGKEYIIRSLVNEYYNRKPVVADMSEEGIAEQNLLKYYVFDIRSSDYFVPAQNDSASEVKAGMLGADLERVIRWAAENNEKLAIQLELYQETGGLLKYFRDRITDTIKSLHCSIPILVIVDITYTDVNVEEITLAKMRDAFGLKYYDVESMGGAYLVPDPTWKEIKCFLINYMERELNIHDVLCDKKSQTKLEAFAKVLEGNEYDYIRLSGFMKDCSIRYGWNKEHGTENEFNIKSMIDFLQEYIGGNENKTEDSKMRKTAIHEAGHAFVNIYHGMESVVATIVPRADYGGFVLPSRDDYQNRYKDNITCRKRIDMCLAGRAAEQVLYSANDDIKTSGAFVDLQMASEIAYLMVHHFGMGTKLFSAVKLGNVGVNPYYEKECIDEAEVILQEEMGNTKNIIREHKAEIMAIATRLMEEKLLTADEIQECIDSAKNN